MSHGRGPKAKWLCDIISQRMVGFPARSKRATFNGESADLEDRPHNGHHPPIKCFWSGGLAVNCILGGVPVLVRL